MSISNPAREALARGAEPGLGEAAAPASPGEEGRAVVLVAVLVPFVLLAITLGLWTWRDFVEGRRAAEQEVVAAAELLDEHARRAFASVDAALLQVADLVGEVGLDRIHGEAGWRRLRSIARGLPPSGAIFVYDRTGETIAASASFPPPVFNASRRAYFEALVSGREDLHIGTILVGTTVHTLFFPVARAIKSADGRVIAIAQIGIDPGYVEGLLSWARSGLGKTLGLYRAADGAVVAREPMAPSLVGETIAGTGPFTAIADGGSVGWTGWSEHDHGRQVTAARRLADFPLIAVATLSNPPALVALRARAAWQLAALAAAVPVLVLLARRLLRRQRERMLTAAALRESEARYRLLHETLRDAFVQVAMDGRIIAHNALYAEMLGFSPEELRTLTYRDLTPEPWHAMEEAIVRDQILARGYSDVYQKEYRRKDGTVVPVELRTILGRDAAGRPAAMWAIVRDISARKRAEDELRLANERFRLALKAAPVVVFSQDLELRYTWIYNPGLGGAADEVVGKHDRDVFERAEDAAVTEALTSQVIQTGVGHRREVEVAAGGVVYCWDLLIEPLRDRDGAISGVVCAAIDITDRKRAVEELSRSQRFETFSRIAGGIAHDFNNLLSVVAGNLELIDTRDLTERVRRAITTSLAAIQDGATLSRRIQQILSAGRRQFPAVRHVVLSEQVATTARLLERTLGGPVTLATEIGPDLWPTLVDPGEVDSVLFNLALNARDAMPDGGTLTIRLDNVTLAAGAPELRPDATPGDYVRLSVADSGCGMTPDLLKRVGEPFFSTKDVGQGTGLGLSSVFAFVRAARGFATLASRVGWGTTVTLYLPRAADLAVAAGTDATDDVPSGDGELILVVEDDDRVRQVALRRLEVLGYAVLEARTAREAITQMRSGEPVDLVFSDISMPGASGYELAAWIRSAHPGVALLLTTGFERGDPRRDDRRAPDGVAVLDKPCTMGALACAVRDALAATRARQAGTTSPVNT